MKPEQLIQRLRNYDKHNHRGKYAVLCHDAAEFIEAAFTHGSGQPEKPAVEHRPNTWTLTPKGFWGESQCALWIEVLRSYGCNAIILNENGVLQFGTVERTDAAPSRTEEK